MNRVFARCSLRRQLAVLVAGALLFAQLAVAAYACPWLQPPAGAEPVAADGIHASALPGCEQATTTALDPASPNLCAEHCKQGQQGDRAGFGVAVPTVLFSVLYETPAVPPPVWAPAPGGAWLSALVAASPPHAIAHCVMRT